jgi:hypothetical protein
MLRRVPANNEHQRRSEHKRAAVSRLAGLSDARAGVKSMETAAGGFYNGRQPPRVRLIRRAFLFNFC